MKIDYSFIVPHRNSFTLLQRCINSIPHEPYVEIIVIDDNSTEQIVSMLKQYDHEDSRVKIIFSNSNIGAGAARNIGLDIAIGKWIVFADCDDFFNPSISSVLKEYRNENNIDLVLFNTNSVDSETLLTIESRGAKYNYLINSSVNSYNKEPRLKYCINPPWGKLIFKELIELHNIRFDEVFAANDVMFSAKCGHNSKNIALNRTVAYCATDCPNSIQKKTTLLYQDSRFDVALRYYVFLKSINKVKHRMNIWKVIFRYFYIEERRPLSTYIEKAYKIIDLKHLVYDFIKMPYLVLKHLWTKV